MFFLYHLFRLEKKATINSIREHLSFILASIIQCCEIYPSYFWLPDMTFFCHIIWLEERVTNSPTHEPFLPPSLHHLPSILAAPFIEAPRTRSLNEHKSFPPLKVRESIGETSATVMKPYLCLAMDGVWWRWCGRVGLGH